jgi:hypothetical protein
MLLWSGEVFDMEVTEAQKIVDAEIAKHNTVVNADAVQSITHADVQSIVNAEVDKHNTIAENADGKTDMVVLKSVGEKVVVEDAVDMDAHDHKWKCGILPGQVYMKSCTVCGVIVKPITQDQWLQTLA